MQKTQYMLFSFFKKKKKLHTFISYSLLPIKFADNVCWLNYFCTRMSIKQNTVHAFFIYKKISA